MAIPFEDSINRTTNAPRWTDEKVADLTARDAISATLRYEGMCVYVTADKKTYQLQGGVLDTDWTEYGSGGGAVVTAYVDKFTDANGIKVAWTLTAAPSDAKQTNVYVGTVYQEKDTYTLAGTSLTFSEAVPTGNNVEVVYNVTTSSIPAASISLVKLDAVVNKALSSASGAFSLAATGTASVFGTPVSLTSIAGRPVRVKLIPDSATSDSNINTVAAASVVTSVFRILKGGATVYTVNYGTQAVGATGVGRTDPPGAIEWTDYDLAKGATGVYQLQVESISNSTVRVNNSRLEAREVY